MGFKVFGVFLAAGIATASVSSTAIATDFIKIGEQGVMIDNYVGCKDQSDEDKFDQLVNEGDKEAAVEFADEKYPDCQHFPTGTRGIVEDLSFLHGKTCLRPRGKPDCLWTPTEFVAKP